jgi:surfeit locus 1 family protein
VSAQGRWLEGRSVLAQALSELGAGFWLLTPLQQADGTQVLVNRGFVPTAERKAFADRIAAAAEAGAAAETVTVTGLMRMSEPGAASCARTLRPKTVAFARCGGHCPAKGWRRPRRSSSTRACPAKPGREPVAPPRLTVIRFPNSHRSMRLPGMGWPHGAGRLAGGAP